MGSSTIQKRHQALNDAAGMPPPAPAPAMDGPSVMGFLKGMGQGLVAPNAQNNLFSRALNQHIGPAGQQLVAQVPSAVEGVQLAASDLGNAVMQRAAPAAKTMVAALRGMVRPQPVIPTNVAQLAPRG